LTRDSDRIAPKRRSGSTSPAIPDRIRSSIADGSSSLKLAMSAASCTSSRAMSAAAARLSPIGTSIAPNPPAACSASAWARPSAVDVVRDQSRISPAESRKTTRFLFVASSRPEAASIALRIP
jgi:hypothetical protein